MDIEAYLHKELADSARDYGILQWPSRSDILALVKRSGQLFIYATTVVLIIFDRVESDPKGQLRRILASSGMEPGMDTLEQLYLDILNAASPPQSKPENHHRLCRVLGAILVLVDPLPPAALERLLGLERGQVRETLMRLHSVLMVPDTAGPMRVIHKSFIDFLTTRCESRFRIDAPAHNGHMAIRCLALMTEQISPLSAFGYQGIVALLTKDSTFSIALTAFCIIFGAGNFLSTF